MLNYHRWIGDISVTFCSLESQNRSGFRAFDGLPAVDMLQMFYGGIKRVKKRNFNGSRKIVHIIISIFDRSK